MSEQTSQEAAHEYWHSEPEPKRPTTFRIHLQEIAADGKVIRELVRTTQANEGDPDAHQSEEREGENEACDLGRPRIWGRFLASVLWWLDEGTVVDAAYSRLSVLPRLPQNLSRAEIETIAEKVVEPPIFAIGALLRGIWLRGYGRFGRAIRELGFCELRCGSLDNLNKAVRLKVSKRKLLDGRCGYDKSRLGFLYSEELSDKEKRRQRDRRAAKAKARGKTDH